MRQHTAHSFRNFSGKALHGTFEEVFVFLRFELLQKNRAMPSMAKLSPLIAQNSPFLA